MTDRFHRDWAGPVSTSPPRLEIRNVTCRFGGRDVVRDVSLSVNAGQVMCLLGPSGCGKSTTLRIIAGVERQDAGSVLVDGEVISDAHCHAPPEARGIGLMFQDFALFPHRDVAGNVGFGLRMARWDAARIRTRVEEVLALVGLPGAGSRAVAQLSGGEQQRVALARALAPSPRLLMLDEPMGSLDRALRERLPDELRRIFETLDLTVLYVTHDQDEALRVAERTIVLRDGRVEADAAPEALWTHPPTRFTATFLGFRNVIEASVAHGRAHTAWGELPVTADVPPGETCLVLRPDALSLAADGPVRGVVTSRRFRGDHVLLGVRVSADAPELEVEARGAALPAVGQSVAIAVDPAGVLPVAG